jgi:hypothetical protein
MPLRYVRQHVLGFLLGDVAAIQSALRYLNDKARDCLQHLIPARDGLCCTMTIPPYYLEGVAIACKHRATRSMSYYMRVYCKLHPAPTIRELLALMALEGYLLCIDARYTSQDLHSPDWREVGLAYADDETPVWLDFEHRPPPAAEADGLSDPELEEMQEELAEIEDSPVKERVLEYLHSARWVAVFQVMGSHTDEAADVISGIAGVLMHDYDGIAYADGGGFWEAGYFDGPNLILSLE